MPRQPRIEYENAIYHVMARGNRREPIVFDDEDRSMFVATLAQACERTGWEVFAWVLLDNHYHLVVRTPNANLVDGMRWFQNAFTRRINVKNRLWGHLFGGRYKAILVESEELHGTTEWRDYLRILIDYVHLNPVRAGLVNGGKKTILNYRWSSVAQGYALPPTRRSEWLAVAEGLDLFGERDMTRGRKRFVERLDGIARSERKESGKVEVEGQSLQSTLRRGWYWGSHGFREQLLNRFGKQKKKGSDRELRGSEFLSDHAEKEAEHIIEGAKAHFGYTEEELARVSRGDLTRTAVAWKIWKRTSVRQKWIAERLSMGTAANVSQQVRKFESVPEKSLTPKLRRWKKN